MVRIKTLICFFSDRYPFRLDPYFAKPVHGNGTDDRLHTGIAIFRPVIDAQGNLSVNVRMDKRITAALNVPGARLKSANIGKTSEEIASMWNEEHPTDITNSASAGPNPF